MMGVERVIRFSPGSAPAWGDIGRHLAVAGEAPVVRMIDGLPAFPDEQPADDWQEVRVGLSAGMVTVRRSAAGEIRCVAWGTADDRLARCLDATAAAVAAATNGQVT